MLACSRADINVASNRGPNVEKQHLPKARLEDGKLFVEGEEESYFRGAIRSLRLTIQELEYRRSFRVEQKKARAASKKAAAFPASLKSIKTRSGLRANPVL